MSWTGRSYSVGIEGDEGPFAYVIGAAASDSTTTSSGEMRTWTFELETAEGSAICTLAKTSGQDGSSALELACPLLPGGGTWVPCWASGRVDVVDIEGSWLEERGTSLEDVSDELTRWCALNAPTATEGAWDMASSDDWEEGYTSLKLTLDNNAKTKVEIRIAHEGGEVSVRRSS